MKPRVRHVAVREQNVATTSALTMRDAETAGGLVTTLGGAHDLVWIVGPEDLNEQLRHSLRSAALYVPHSRAWIAGYTPSWVADNVGRIPVAQDHGKHANSTMNLLAACKHPDVSDPFVWMHDDMFALRPIERLPLVNKGTMSEFFQRLSTRYGTNYPYLNGLRATRELIAENISPDPLSYEMHVPLLVYKEPMIKAIEISMESKIHAVHKRSVYGNLHYPRDSSVTVDDPKIAFSTYPMNWPDTWVSTSDQSWRGRTGQRLRQEFLSPCVYES